MHSVDANVWLHTALASILVRTRQPRGFGLCCASGFEAIIQDPVKILPTVILTEHAEVLFDFYYELADYNPFG